jgi:hypothetical protein
VLNERTKLTANWLNAIAAGVIVTGAIAPVVAFVYGVTRAPRASHSLLALLSVVWIAIGIAPYFLAVWRLTRLRS